MRTSLSIDDRLLRDAKIVASKTGKTISEVFEEAFRQMLLRGKIPRPAHRPLPVFKKKMGIKPGIDLDNNAALAEMMDLEDWKRWHAPSGR